MPKKRVRETKELLRACDSCGKEFVKVQYKQRFCSHVCYRAAHHVYARTWREKQPKGYDINYRFEYRCRKNGTTPQEYQTFWDLQQGLCAICRKNPIRDIDHSHRTGKARGLLCGKCNMGLGLFQEDIDLLMSAAAYLERTERD